MRLGQEEENNSAFLSAVRGEVTRELRSGTLRGSSEGSEALLMEPREK